MFILDSVCSPPTQSSGHCQVHSFPINPIKQSVLRSFIFLDLSAVVYSVDHPSSWKHCLFLASVTQDSHGFLWQLIYSLFCSLIYSSQVNKYWNTQGSILDTLLFLFYILLMPKMFPQPTSLLWAIGPHIQLNTYHLHLEASLASRI